MHLRSRRCNGEKVSTHARCAIVPLLHSVPCAAALYCYLSAWPRPQSTPWTGSPWTSLTDGRAPLRNKFAHDATGTSGDRMYTGTFALKTGQGGTCRGSSGWVNDLVLHAPSTRSHTLQRICAGTGQSSSSVPSTNASAAAAAPILQGGYACKVYHSMTRLGSCSTASL